jgi:hypothetical protein
MNNYSTSTLLDQYGSDFFNNLKEQNKKNIIRKANNKLSSQTPINEQIRSNQAQNTILG